MPERRNFPCYSPDEDSTTWVEAIAALLMDNRGRRVHIEEELGGDPWVIHDAIELLRELGWDIRGDKGKRGYCLNGWHRPPKWMHVVDALRAHLASIVLDRPMDDPS